ncbi:uncharacterized protein LOC131649855 [Vicia villosa]|uniref:uncharacterized protein LOC131649855 n=1 Tax=Vicia villosa TaxID=3911 RepID=UPI00273C99E8|nr:uncharacterized protein LOC131649855 [Vicia villosa]
MDDETVQQNQIPRLRPSQGGVRGRHQQVVMVNRQQDADQFVEQYQHEEAAIENNLTTIIERIMARNGLNTPLQRPTYSSSLAEYIVQTENPRGWKIPKYTKFGGETGESTVEHIAKYLTESGDMANNESLRVKYFPSSLTKVAFTWFTTLPPNSVDSWPKLEKLFHEQFYEGHSKISLVELSNIKRRFADTIDDYLNGCRRDLVQKSLQEGRLKFAARRMKIDTDPLKQEDALFVDLVNINMVELTELPDNMLEESTGESPQVQLADMYPRMDKDLLDFLFRCKNKDSQVGLCPRCSALTDRIAAEFF